MNKGQNRPFHKSMWRNGTNPLLLRIPEPRSLNPLLRHLHSPVGFHLAIKAQHRPVIPALPPALLGVLTQVIGNAPALILPRNPQMLLIRNKGQSKTVVGTSDRYSVNGISW